MRNKFWWGCTLNLQHASFGNQASDSMRHNQSILLCSAQQSRTSQEEINGYWHSFGNNLLFQLSPSAESAANINSWSKLNFVGFFLLFFVFIKSCFFLAFFFMYTVSAKAKTENLIMWFTSLHWDIFWEEISTKNIWGKKILVAKTWI